jgi:hypothetical protein
LKSDCGAQHGDPLAPLYFCAPLQKIVQEISELKPKYNKWYMDDGGIGGHPEMLQLVWNILVEKGPPLGMHLNSSKSEWSWLDPTCKLPCPIRIFELDKVTEAPAELQIALIPTSEIMMLGVPLRPTAFANDYISKKLIKNSAKVMDKLAMWDDSQAAYYMLRSSYSIVRANHFMRTTPLPNWEVPAAAFDLKVRKTAEQILCFGLNEPQYDQASMSSKVGGLSLRRVVSHAPSAYSASRNESKRFSKEKWAPSPFVTGPPGLDQRERSAAVDKAQLKTLKLNANDRDTRKLEELQMPHANAWLSTAPSYVNGIDNRMTPPEFLVATSRLLSRPVHPTNTVTSCPLCEHPMNPLGDHSLSCVVSGDRITRHNRTTNVTGRCANDGGLNPDYEKRGILGETDGRRPGDISIKFWSGGKHLAIDVAVIDPLGMTYLASQDSAVEKYAADKKIAKYESAFKAVESQWDFCPLVCATTGGINAAGADILRQIFRFASHKTGERYCVYAAKAWSHFSVSLQRSVAQQILSRTSKDIG